MLQIKLDKTRLFDEASEEFVYFEPTTLKLEHSLISIQKWESKWHKSFLSSSDKTLDEMMDYIRCMSLDPNVDPRFTMRLTEKEILQIKEYMDNPMTATTFSLDQKRPNHQIITAEIIYFWMTSMNIPFECAKWHINQLLTLIQVCSIKNNPKKMSKKEAGAQRAALNKARRAKLGSSG